MKALLGLVFASAVSFSTIAVSATLPVTGSVTWEAKGNPGLVKIDATGGKPTGTLTVDGGKASGTVECAMADFTTGIDKRDEHAKTKYLEVDKYPKATFVLDPVPTTGNQAFQGKLTLKGVTKPVIGHAHFNSPTDVEATFTISLDDYNVGVPSFMGVTVAKDVTVTVKLHAK